MVNDYYMYLLVNIILHVCILFTILGAFFLFYISSIEEREYKKEISSLTKDLKKELESVLEPYEKEEKQFKKALQELPFESLYEIYKQPAKATTINNNWLKIVIWTVVCFLFIILFSMLSIYYFRCGGCKINFYEVLTENIFIFIFVGTIEICFFLFIAAKYVPVKPSTMSDVFLETLKTQFS